LNLPEIRNPEPTKAAPTLPTSPVGKANLTNEAIKIGRIAFYDGAWTSVQSKGQLYRGLLADISNVPLDSGNITTVKVNAAIKIGYGGRTSTYSPLPWLEEFTNTVRLGPAARKVIVLAVGEDSLAGPWYFVLNHVVLCFEP
jgi:hypothetical protein